MNIKKYFRAKEISWLYFNERVLQESENKDVPIIERLKFLGIYSSNLDEFFRVRVATLKRLTSIGKKAIDLFGNEPKAILKQINDIVIKQNSRFQNSYHEIIKDLAKENVYIINENKLNSKQLQYVNEFFENSVKIHLMPIMLDQISAKTKLKDDIIYLAISLINDENKSEYSILEIPTNKVCRFIKLPSSSNDNYFILLDDIIRIGLKFLYHKKYTKIEAYTFKVTRDAELDINDDISEGYVKNLSKSLQKRKDGNPVRFVYDENIPNELLNILIRKLKYRKEDTIIPGGRYHNFKDFMSFPVLNTSFVYERPENIKHPLLLNCKDFFKNIASNDIMTYFPYHSFNCFIELLKVASYDSKVKEIKITLYRLAKNSIVVESLLNAARNNKSVTVVVELQARFDEEANIELLNKLKSEGIKVIYGVPGIKVHSKICLITRKENNSLNKYAVIGSGNFNETTAKVYTDILLYTSDKKITNDVSKIFDFFAYNYKIKPFNHLIVSPFNSRINFKKLIKKEISNAKAGKKAFIHIKINNLADPEIIKLFYEANNAGVEIKLNVRGMFSLVNNIDGISNGIQAKAIVDKYLEHSRIYIFCNNGNEKVFISSADLLTRNIDRRVEVTCPIYNENIKKEILDIFEISWKDNVKARNIDQNLTNSFYKDNNPEFRSQFELYKYFSIK